MLIKCPQCSVGYNIPDKVIGEKPKKMACSKCKHVFTVARKSEVPRKGYTEFTGKQHLPPEFAFLHAEKPAPPKAATPPPPPQNDDPQPEEVHVEIPSEPPVEHAAPAPAQTPAQAPAQVPAQAVQPPRRSMPAVDMFDGSTGSAWEVEAPMELGGFAMTDEMPTGNQAIGKIMFVAIVLVVGFFVFVAARNGWSISPVELPSQIAFAFSGGELETLPPEVENIDTTVESKRIVLTNAKDSYLNVQGEIINNNNSSRDNILLRARLVDPSGEVRDEVRFPCGKTVDDKIIKKTAKGAVEGHYMTGGKPYNCHISPNGSTIFQAIFVNVPADYDSAFEVLVVPVAAKQ